MRHFIGFDTGGSGFYIDAIGKKSYMLYYICLIIGNVSCGKSNIINFKSEEKSYNIISSSLVTIDEKSHEKLNKSNNLTKNIVSIEKVDSFKAIYESESNNNEFRKNIYNLIGMIISYNIFFFIEIFMYVNMINIYIIRIRGDDIQLNFNLQLDN